MRIYLASGRLLLIDMYMSYTLTKYILGGESCTILLSIQQLTWVTELYPGWGNQKVTAAESNLDKNNVKQDLVLYSPLSPSG